MKCGACINNSADFGLIVSRLSLTQNASKTYFKNANRTFNQMSHTQNDSVEIFLCRRQIFALHDVHEKWQEWIARITFERKVFPIDLKSEINTEKSIYQLGNSSHFDFDYKDY